MLVALILIGSFFVGSVPFGVFVARANGVDIRSMGSGNIGATNVHRVLGGRAGALVMALDMLKGAIPAIVAASVLGSPDWGFGAGIVAVLGHIFSPFLGFKGGKGIATGLGALFGSFPLIATCVLAVFLLTLMLSGFVSLASLVGSLAMIGLGFVFHASPVGIAAFTLVSVLFFVKHRANIQRIRAGTEPKFQWKSKGMKPSEPTEPLEPPIHPEDSP